MLFASTKISGALPDLSSLLKLTYLSIKDTKISPRCDLIIPQLSLGTTRIDSDTCNDGMLPPSIERLVKLETFIGSTSLSGESLSQIYRRL